MFLPKELPVALILSSAGPVLPARHGRPGQRCNRFKEMP